MDWVLALRQPLSEPTCEKPSVMVFVPPPPAAGVAFLPHAATAVIASSPVAARTVARPNILRLLIMYSSLREWMSYTGAVVRRGLPSAEARSLVPDGSRPDSSGAPC